MTSPFASVDAFQLEPRDEQPRYVVLKYGTLPMRSFLASRIVGHSVTVDETLNVLRQCIAAGLETSALQLLNAFGFTWAAEPALPDAGMQEAIDSVAAAEDRRAPYREAAELRAENAQLRAELANWSTLRFAELRECARELLASVCRGDRSMQLVHGAALADLVLGDVTPTCRSCPATVGEHGSQCSACRAEGAT